MAFKVAIGAPEANREAAFFMSASEVLGSMVAVRSFSMIVSILEVSPRKFAGLRTVHLPSSEPKVRCNFAPLISTLVSLSKSTGMQALVAQVFQTLVQICFCILGDRIHFGFAGNHDVRGVARRRLVADQDGLRLPVFSGGGNLGLGLRQAKLLQIGGLFLNDRGAIHRRQIVQNRRNRILIGDQRFRRSDFPVRRAGAVENDVVAVLFLDFQFGDVVLRQGNNFGVGRARAGGHGVVCGLAMIGPIKRRGERCQHNGRHEELSHLHHDFCLAVN